MPCLFMIRPLFFSMNSLSPFSGNFSYLHGIWSDSRWWMTGLDQTFLHDISLFLFQPKLNRYKHSKSSNFLSTNEVKANWKDPKTLWKRTFMLLSRKKLLLEETFVVHPDCKIYVIWGKKLSRLHVFGKFRGKKLSRNNSF